MARVSRETAAAHRAAMVAAASRLFRARGIDRVGVAEITREAGLTHGGFYGHFADKSALAAEAVAAAFAESRARIDETDVAHWMRAYLSRSHRDHPESGCPLPALATEVVRAEAPVRERFAEGLDLLVTELAKHQREPDEAARRAHAWDVLATMVGGLALARALATVDVAASDEVLKSLRDRLKARAALG